MSETKDDAYYSACLAAWISNRMEGDRTLVALSAGGVGVLLTIVSLLGTLNQSGFWFFTISGGLFVIVIIAGIFVFRWNSDLLEAEIGIVEVLPGEKEQIEKRLGILDHVMRWGFILAIVMAMGLGLQVGASHLIKQEDENMSEDRANQKPTNIGTITEGLQGVRNLNPGLIGGNRPATDGTSVPSPIRGTTERGLQGISNLRPSGGNGQSTSSGSSTSSNGSQGTNKE